MSRETRSVTWSIGKAAQAVTLSPASVTVSEGETATITASWLGDGVLSAVSSDAGVATVAVSGSVITVTGVSEGAAVITATVSEGTNYLAGSATAEAGVEAPGIIYYGTVTDLSTYRSSLAGASVGGYALFGGGFGGSTSRNTVDAYDTSLTRSTPTGLSTDRSSLAGASVGGYALFGGGEAIRNNYWSATLNTVDAYDTSLTRSTPTGLSVARDFLTRASVGNYAMFGGGNADRGVAAVYPLNTVDAYDTSLTRSTPTGLSTDRSSLAGASVGGYALFGGGYDNSLYLNTVDAYDTSLTRSTPTGLSVARDFLAGASVGGYALFGGGSGANNVDAYEIVA